MGFFERFGRRGEAKRLKEARAKELGGDLAAATELYVEANQPDEAARVLLVRADAETNPEKRMAFCALALRTAVGAELKQRARARKARLGFDLLVGRGAGAMPSEVLAVAQELEAAGDLERAAEAYALAGDPEAEVRVLTAAGAIERLEERLRASADSARQRRDREHVLGRIRDLARTAERRAAVELATSWTAQHDDERVMDLLREIRARLVGGPVVHLWVDGEAATWAFGDEVTVGRGDATIVVASRAISRRHLRLRRAPEGVVVEDLATRNGTTLAGAKVTGPIPVGSGVSLVLGGEVPVTLSPLSPEPASAIDLEVAGARYRVPLGEVRVGPWRLGFEQAAAAPFLVLCTPEGARRPFLGNFELASRVELAVGDEIGEERRGQVRLRVLAEPARGGRP